MEDLTKTRYYDMDKIRSEFLKYAPSYAQKEAGEAIAKIMDLQMQRVLQNGLYYIVLVDLVGSTKYGVEHGNDSLSERIKYFVTSSFEALNDAKILNVGLFVKEIGDAILYIFHHFPDILRWLAMYDKYLKSSIDGDYIIVRTCIHIGEVSLEGVNPLSLAVSQTFKMEKKVSGGDVVLTYPAYTVAWPTLARAYHGFKDYGDVELDGYKEPVKLYQLVINDENDISRILQERID